MRHGSWLAVAVLGYFAGAGTLVAQQEEGQRPERRAAAKERHDPAAMSEQEMMDAWMEANKKTQQHEQLAQGEGMWKFEGQHWMAPGAPPVPMTGTAKMKSILDGRWLQEKVESDVGGMPFQGISTVGYDNIRGKYINTWIDSMSNGMFYSEGEEQPDGSIVFEGTMTDPMTKQAKNVKQIVRHESPDSMSFEMYEPAPGTGEMFKVMEMTYTRTGPLPRDEADHGMKDAMKEGMKDGMKKTKGGMKD